MDKKDIDDKNTEAYLEKAMLKAGFKGDFSESPILLGEGSCGRVFKIKMSDRSGYLAVKILNDGRGALSEGEVLFCDFSKKKENLENWPSSLVKIHAVDSTSGIVIMDYVPGLSLAELVGKVKTKAKGVTVCEVLGGLEGAVSLARKMFLSLDYMHSKGYAHRDVKGSNIILDGMIYSETPQHFTIETSGLTPKFIDFGLFETSENRNEMCGTLRFMAPEIFEDKPHDAAKSDMWALGIALLNLFNSLGNMINFTGVLDATFVRVRFKEFKTSPKKFEAHVKKLISQIEPEALRGILGPMLGKVLVFDPAKRITAQEAETILGNNYSSYLKNKNSHSSPSLLSNDNNDFLSSPISTTTPGENISRNNQAVSESSSDGGYTSNYVDLTPYRNQVSFGRNIVMLQEEEKKEKKEEKGKEDLKNQAVPNDHSFVKKKVSEASEDAAEENEFLRYQAESADCSFISSLDNRRSPSSFLDSSGYSFVKKKVSETSEDAAEENEFLRYQVELADCSFISLFDNRRSSPSPSLGSSGHIPVGEEDSKASEEEKKKMEDDQVAPSGHSFILSSLDNRRSPLLSLDSSGHIPVGEEGLKASEEEKKKKNNKKGLGFSSK
jgi:serine/threonine protein kinase